MRRDAKTLLDRLNRSGFEYHDFTEVAEEVELWPLFKVLLRDPQIVGERKPADPVGTTADKLAPGAELEQKAPVHPAVSLFDRYRAAISEMPTKRPEPEPSLREFLKKIGGDRA